MINIDPVAFADSLETLANSEYGEAFYIVLNDVKIHNVYLDKQALSSFSFYDSIIKNLTCEIYTVDDVFELKRAVSRSLIGKLTIKLHDDFDTNIEEMFNNLDVEELVIESK